MNGEQSPNGEQRLNGEQRPDVLVTDLDGPLRPLEHHHRHRADLQWWITARYQAGWKLVYLTHRTATAVCERIVDQHLPLPDAVVADSGTSLYHAEMPFRLTLDESFDGKVDRQVGNVDWSTLEQSVRNVRGMTLMDAEYQSKWKRVFTVDPEYGSEAMTALPERLQSAGLAFEAIRALPDESERWRVELVPTGTSLREPLDRWLSKQAIAPERVVYAADSRSELVERPRGSRGLLVSRADMDTVSLPDVYVASAEAASGVIEGWRFFQTESS